MTDAQSELDTLPKQPCDGTCGCHDDEEPPTLESESQQQARQAGEITDEVDNSLETLDSVAYANLENAKSLRSVVDLLFYGGRCGDDLNRRFAEKISKLIGINHDLDEALDRLDPCPVDAETLSDELSVGPTLKQGGQTEGDKMAEQRYFVDVRGGCIAVRDRTQTDPDYQGLQDDTPGVVKFWKGVWVNGGWVVTGIMRETANGACREMNVKVGDGLKPSDFRKHPNRSVPGTSQHEKLAVDIMRTLVKLGDSWQHLSWEQFIVSRDEYSWSLSVGVAEMFFNAVIPYCRDAEAAATFSPVWAKVAEVAVEDSE